MKKLALLFLTISTLCASCSSNEEEFAKDTEITINFTHSWEDDEVTSDDFEVTEYRNENGETLTIARLRYLISNIYVINESDITTELSDYFLVNLGENTTTLSIENTLLDGTYDLYITFGFTDEDNYTEEGYTDLTSEVFDVPSTLGGGYHYMQFDGKYINDTDVETGFNFHAVRATTATGETQEEILATGQDTSFEISLGEIEIEDNEVTIEINMDIAQWFEDPEDWDLNIDFENLMSDFNAQTSISTNGKTVFSLVKEEDEDEDE